MFKMLPIRLVACLSFCLAFGLSPVFAQESPPGALADRPPPQRRAEPRPSGEGLPPLPANATTHHVLALPGRTLNFSATAGTIRLFDAASGAPQADIATIFYALDGTRTRERPVTFVFNGGPGYASGWLNLGGLGPWRLPMLGDAARPSALPALENNAETWLDFTDLVFIDPAGTGYSRILGNDEVRKSLWSIAGDVSALAVSIRRWVQANGRELSPKFILGESYGGFRAPKIAHALQTEQGIGVNGLVLVSPVLDFARFGAENSVLGHVARLPGFVATVRERKGPITRESLKDVETYATGEFLSDLMKGVNDEAALTRLANRVADLTGLDRGFVRQLGARIPSSVFAREINRSTQRISSLYDGNVTGLDPDPIAIRSNGDDALRLALHAPITEAMADLYRNRLNWVVENGRYQFFNEQAGRQWDREHGQREALRDLRTSMALDPALRVLVAHGLTDLVTPYFETRMELDQLPDFGTPDRLRFKVYPGGHMVYLRDEGRRQLREDGQRLIEGR